MGDRVPGLLRLRAAPPTVPPGSCTGHGWRIG